jgi:hypothetical protein
VETTAFESAKPRFDENTLKLPHAPQTRINVGIGMDVVITRGTARVGGSAVPTAVA